jgi:hypothetical protein
VTKIPPYNNSTVRLFLQDGLVNPSRQIGKKRDVFLKLCKKMHKKDKKSRDYQENHIYKSQKRRYNIQCVYHTAVFCLQKLIT